MKEKIKTKPKKRATTKKSLREKILHFGEKGYDSQRIAELCNCTRTNVYMTLNKERYEKNKELKLKEKMKKEIIDESLIKIIENKELAHKKQLEQCKDKRTFVEIIEQWIRDNC